MPYSHPWGHDRAWEREIVDRIRRGGEAPHALSPYDVDPSPYYAVSVNAGGWEQAEEYSKSAIRTNAVYLNDEAIAARQKQRTELRAAFKEMLAKEKINRELEQARREVEKAERAERKRRADEEHAKWEAAREAEWKLWQEGQAARDRLAAARKAGWETSRQLMQLLTEERGILASKWICTECNSPSVIVREGLGYRLSCTNCGKSAWGSHEALMKVRAT